MVQLTVLSIFHRQYIKLVQQCISHEYGSDLYSNKHY